MPKRKSPDRVYTKHVVDHLCRNYLYKPRKDELFIIIDGYPKKRTYELGKCKEKMKQDLASLIVEYNKAVEEYEKANDEVQELFEEKEEIEAEIDSENEAKGCYGYRDCEERGTLYSDNGEWCDVMDVLHKEALPERNDLSSVVAWLYFIIAQK